MSEEMDLFDFAKAAEPEKEQDSGLKKVLDEANSSYRTGGDSGMSDEEYDFLLAQIGDENYRERVGYEVEKNKVELPVPMGSLNKVKTDTELADWLKSKDIPVDTRITVTPKYDGLSLLVEFREGKLAMAATRGNGVEGQDVTEHFRANPLVNADLPKDFNGFLIGEAIMSEELFAEKYAEEFKNPRNMVAGLLSRKVLSAALADISFVAYAIRATGFEFKQEQVDFCNRYVNVPLYKYPAPSLSLSAAEIANEALAKFFASETNFKCDGLVLEVDEHLFFKQLGAETNSLNPAGARAWKPESDDSRPAKVQAVRWQVSKAGYLKPVVEIEPVELGGVTISNVTGINAKFIKENEIAREAIVSIIRSGDVIPKIIKVLLPSQAKPLPDVCPCCEGELVWNKSDIELQCQNSSCREKVLSELADFFKIMEIDEVGEGVIKSLMQAGCDSMAKILSLSVLDLLKLEGFQEKKAQKVYENIHAKLKAVPLSRLQHASNLFSGLGKKKLELLEKYDAVDKVPSQEEIEAVDGFSEVLALSYLQGIKVFWPWAQGLPIEIRAYKEQLGGVLEGKAFVFTGFRDKELEARVKDLGAKMSSGVSKKTTVLVVKAKGSGSSKEKKAESLGVPIMNQEEFLEFLESSI